MQNRDEFKKRLDAELGHFVFGRKSQVIEAISSRHGSLKRWLEKEITIPVGLFACVVLILATLLASQCYTIIHMDNNEIERSRILVETCLEGNSNEMYQN